MSASITPINGDVDPADIWPGAADVDPRGIELAAQMLIDLEEQKWQGGPLWDEVHLSEMLSLGDWKRQGAPYRNLIAERLTEARSAGPEVEFAFLATLGDYLSTAMGENIVNLGMYRKIAERIRQQREPRR